MGRVKFSENHSVTRNLFFYGVLEKGCSNGFFEWETDWLILSKLDCLKKIFIMKNPKQIGRIPPVPLPLEEILVRNWRRGEGRNEFLHLFYLYDMTWKTNKKKIQKIISNLLVARVLVLVLVSSIRIKDRVKQANTRLHIQRKQKKKNTRRTCWILLGMCSKIIVKTPGRHRLIWLLNTCYACFVVLKFRKFLTTFLQFA